MSRRWSRVAALMTVAVVTAGTASAQSIVRVRTTGVSVIATYSDDTFGAVQVGASLVVINGTEEVFLNVAQFDSASGIEACGSALVPKTVLDVRRQRVGLIVDLSAVEWIAVCDDGAGTPSGVINLSFAADGAFRARQSGARQEWFPTFLIHSNGTFEEQSARVTGEMLNVIAPAQAIQGVISRVNDLVITVEQRVP